MTFSQRVAASLLLAVLFSACSASDVRPSTSSGQVDENGGRPAGFGNVLNGLPGIDSSGHITDATSLANELQARGIGDAQVAAVADGSLSLDEFVSLTQLEVSCAEDAGADVSGPTIVTALYGVEVPTYTWTIDPTLHNLDDVDAAILQCTSEYTIAYGMLYRASMGPSLEEQNRLLAEAATSFVECANESGSNPPLSVVEPEDLPAFFSWRATLSPNDPSIDCPFEP